MMTDHVWVIEMLCENGEWQPTVGSAIDKAGAQLELKEWKDRNPSDKFRIAKYGRITK